MGVVEGVEKEVVVCCQWKKLSGIWVAGVKQGISKGRRGMKKGASQLYTVEFSRKNYQASDVSVSVILPTPLSCRTCWRDVSS
jgi:hypothetical protein